MPRIMEVDEKLSCAVCGFQAEGNHFGAPCCKACAAFFRRSVAEDKQYRCRRQSECNVMRNNRNQCRHCRFKKCFEVGMTKEDDEVVSLLPATSLSLADPAQLKSADHLAKLNVAFNTFCTSQRSLFNLENVKSALLLDNVNFVSMKRTEHNRMESNNATLIAALLMEHFPAFRELDANYKRSLFGPFATRFINFHRCWLTSKHFPLPEDVRIAFHYGYYSSIQDAEIFFGNIPNLEDIRRHISPIKRLLRKVSLKIASLNLSNHEIGAVIGLILYTQLETLNLWNQQRKHEKTILLSELHNFTMTTYGLAEGPLRFANIFELLLDLENVVTTFSHAMVLGNLVLEERNELFMLIADSVL